MALVLLLSRFPPRQHSPLCSLPFGPCEYVTRWNPPRGVDEMPSLSPPPPAQDGGGQNSLDPPLPAAPPLPSSSSSSSHHFPASPKPPSCPRAPAITLPCPWATLPLWNQKPELEPWLWKPPSCHMAYHPPPLQLNITAIAFLRIKLLLSYSSLEEDLDPPGSEELPPHPPGSFPTIGKRTKKL